MFKRIDGSKESPSQQRIRHRGRKRRQKEGPSQIRVVGLVKIKLLNQTPTDCEENTRNAKGRNDSEHAIGAELSRVKAGQILTENEQYINLQDLGEDNIIFCFFANGDTESNPTYQAELVNSFCRKAALQELQSNDPGLSSRKVCLIDDRTNDDAAPVSVGAYQPLTVHEMYSKLKEKRYHPASSSEGPVQLSAHRRLIFMTDPDGHGVVALMATAPLSQVNALSEFFYNYIAFKPHIGIFNESRGPPNFAFSFHLPFYSWTSTEQEPRDLRLKQDGHRPSSLRCVHNMCFLQGESQGPPFKIDYLCEAQVSILITGINHRIWTGFCFVDTYYQPEDRRQTVEDYYESELQMDPFTDGRCDAGKPILDPGEYFLTDFECQLKRFKNEWMNTAEKFKQQVEEYIDEFKFPPTRLGRKIYQVSQQPLTWLRQTRRKLSKLIESLDTTLNCWDNFASKDQFRTLYGRRSLVIIGLTFVETKNCLKDLQNIRTLCDEFEKMFNLHTIEVGNHAAYVQAQVVESNQTLSHLLLYAVSPVTLTAAILSMQQEAIPGFLGPNKLSFIVLMPIMVVIVFALSKIIYSWEKIQIFILHLLRRQQVYEEEEIELV